MMCDAVIALRMLSSLPYKCSNSSAAGKLDPESTAYRHVGAHGVRPSSPTARTQGENRLRSPPGLQSDRGRTPCATARPPWNSLADDLTEEVVERFGQGRVGKDAVGEIGRGETALHRELDHRHQLTAADSEHGRSKDFARVSVDDCFHQATDLG